MVCATARRDLIHRGARPASDARRRRGVAPQKAKESYGLTVFSFEASEKVLSIVAMRKASQFMRAMHTNEVLTC